MLMRPEYEQKVGEMMDEVNPRRAEEGLAPLSKEDFVSQMIQHFMNESGVADTELNPDAVGHTPKMSAFSPRAWAWITEGYGDVPVSQQSKDDWSSLMEGSLYGTLHNYIEQGVKRSIYTKRFGANGKKLKGVLEQARMEGASDRDIRNAQKYIDAMLGTYGFQNHERLIKGANWVRRKLGKEEWEMPKPGQPINPRLQKVTQWMMVYQNFRILDFAVITSLVDPVGIFARSGDVRVLGRAFKAGVADVYNRRIKGEDSMVNSIAEMIGAVENHMLSESVQWNSSGNFMSGRARQFNDQFFKWNGLQGWTRITRVMATSAAQQFLKYHAARQNDPTSVRYLQELGLNPEDIASLEFDQGGNIKLMPEDEYNKLVSEARTDPLEASDATKRAADRYQNMKKKRDDIQLSMGARGGVGTRKQRKAVANLEEGMRKIEKNLKDRGYSEGQIEQLVADSKQRASSESVPGPVREKIRDKLSREDRIRYAMLRFTNEAVLRPNAAHRPIWASDPHFAVFFHLKQFMWSFHARVLGRMAHEAQYGNFAPVMGAALMYILVMGAADELRELLKYGTEGNPNTAHWGFTDRVWNSIQRAGLTGTYQAMLDSQEDRMYGGYGFESFMGPTANQAWNFMKTPWKDSEFMDRQLNRAIVLNNTRQTLGLNYGDN
jgi:hypothetical protein